MNAEKNDVDISKLFVWSGEFPLLDEFGNTKTTVWMKLLGDAELNRARVYAIRRSAELRKKLKDENSDEYVAFFSVLDEAETKEDLIEMVSYASVKRYTEEATKELIQPLPAEPRSDADLEEFEKFQEKVDNYEAERQSKTRELVEKKVELGRKALERETEESLRKLYKQLMVGDFCEREMIGKFREGCIYFGTFKDSEFKVKAFGNIEEVNNLPTHLKEQLLSYYLSLEVNVGELKKSLEATQSE